MEYIKKEISTRLKIIVGLVGILVYLDTWVYGKNYDIIILFRDKNKYY